MTRPRILLAKPGLDGHDRGIKVVAMFATGTAMPDAVEGMLRLACSLEAVP